MLTIKTVAHGEQESVLDENNEHIATHRAVRTKNSSSENDLDEEKTRGTDRPSTRGLATETIQTVSSGHDIIDAAAMNVSRHLLASLSSQL